MVKTPLKKCLVCGILVLFVGMSTMPLAGSLSVEKHVSKVNKSHCEPINTDGKTLYVGGSGPGNYTKIQGAIDDANPGDTVFVYDDSSPYYEHVIIDKSIDLIGENKNTTTIDGEGNGKVVWIQDYIDGVTISGFTIQKGGYDPYGLTDAGIFISSSSNIIHNNNIVNNNGFGIIVWLDQEETYNNIIYGNTVKNNRDGIAIIGSLDYKIFDNYISKNSFGIYFAPLYIPTKGASCSSNGDGRIYRNNFTNNNVGIYQFDWGGDDIYENKIINNRCGIAMDNMYRCGGYNNIFNNSIMKNGLGIEIHACIGGSTNNNIYQNNITSNRKGIRISSQYDDMYGGADDNKIYQNNFIGNLFYNARDWCKNQWDNGTIGNYWDDYKGKDNNGDGIGDVPYQIRPYLKGNKDRYPLMKPIGNITNILSIQQNSQSQSNSQQSQSSPQGSQQSSQLLHNLILRHQTTS